MTTITIVDGNAFVRRKLEAARDDGGGLIVRNVYTDIDQMAPPTIVAWDGPGAKKTRQKVFPGYKAKRPPGSENMYENMELISKLLSLSHCLQVRVPGAEADDVIAALVVKYHKDHDLIVHTNDRDMLQLGDFVTFSPKLELEGVKPQWVRLYKTLVGDPSDEIPGATGFGPKSWEKLTDHDRFQIEAWITGVRDPQFENAVSKAQYNWMIENVELLRTFWDVIGFIPLTDETIDQHTTVGVRNAVAVQEIFQQFLMT